jgi:hypothetical protein
MASRWSITEPASINDMTQLPRAGRWESQTLGQQHESIVNETQRGVRYGSHLFKRQLLPGIIFEFPRELASQYQAISDATFGRVKPFYFVLDENHFEDLLYLRLDEDSFLPDVFGPGAFEGTMQQWFRWVMRASAEVADQPLLD